MPDFENVNLLKSKILEKRPVLAGLFKKYGNMPVAEYSETLGNSPRTVEAGRKREFINGMIRELERYFPERVAGSVARQLESEYVVSTAEHQGPLTHPFFVHANLLAGHRPQGGAENIIVLAVGNVSLNNSSYPRGIIFHSADGMAHHLPFFPSGERMAVFFNHRPFQKADLARMRNTLLQKVRNHSVSWSAATQVGGLIDGVYSKSEVLLQPTYNHQVILTNQKLWEAFSQNNSHRMPRLVMLQLEDVVLRLIVDHHLFAPTEIRDLLFDPEAHRLLLRYGDGIPGNFTLRDKKGTFLFWALRKNTNERQQLWAHNGYLESPEGYRVALDPISVHSAIIKGELIPSTFLSLLLLSEYYGVRCLGGFSQGTYLTRMHEAYYQMNGKSPAWFDSSHSEGLRSDFVLAHFRGLDGNLHAASGIDLAVHSQLSSWEAFAENISRLTLEEAMAPLFPELYRILYHDAERDRPLLAVTGNDIDSYYGISKKIKPVIAIPA